MERTADRPATVDIAGAARRALPTLALWTAIAAQAVLALATLGIAAVLREYYSVSGSHWAVIAMYLAWAVAIVALIATARRRPMATPLIPAANAALLSSLVTFGVQVLGWSA